MSFTQQQFNMGNFNAQDAQYNRNNRTQAPEFAPGQNPNADSANIPNLFGPQPGSGADLLNQGTGTNNGAVNIFGNVDLSNPTQANTNNAVDIFNQGGMSTNPFAPGAPGMNPNAQQQPQKSTEDIIFDKAKDAVVGSFNYLKDLTKSLQDTTALFWTIFGYRMTIVSGVIAGLGIISSLFGYKAGFTIFITSFVLAFLGAFLWLMTADSAKKCTSKYKSDNTEVVPPPVDTNMFNTPIEEPAMSGFNFSEIDEDDDDFSFDEDEEYEDEDYSEEVTPPMSIDEALDKFQVIDKGMYTRQYLYETFIRVLPSLCPNFTKVETFEEDDDKFLYWDEILTDRKSVV